MTKFIGLLFAIASTASQASPMPTGYMNKGALIQSRNLYEFIREHSNILKSVSPKQHQFGTDQMAQTLIRIGETAHQLGLSPVRVGDISLREGGQLALHLTHQRGLDADVAYLVKQPKKSGHRGNRFHNRFTQKWQTATDVKRDFLIEDNYKLIKEIFTNPEVKSVYVGCAIYDALEKHDAMQTASVLDHVFAQKGHEDHFHVRIKCPEGVEECRDEWWTDPTKPEKAGPKRQGKWRGC